MLPKAALRIVARRRCDYTGVRYGDAMADLIVACGRRPVAEERLRAAALLLAPPEMPVRPPRLLASGGVAVAVANPTEEGVWLHDGGEQAAAGGGACVGGLFGALAPWWRCGTEAPDGTYALARWDARVLELVSDVCATRTLWYVLADDVFLASTSQRALVALLGGFELQPEAVAAFLTTGGLGPEASWDARIRRVPPDARVTLDRESWRVSITEVPVEFTYRPGDDGAQVARLRDAIAATCGALNIDVDRWVLALSGGSDSRTLLAFLLRNGLRPRCVTWTTRASLHRPLSDASLARVLTRRHGVEHELLFLDPVDLETTITRFVAANEGRNDEIVGYLDGFALWRRLARAGVQGIIRGDEWFGPRKRVRDAESRRRVLGGATPSDYPEGHLLRSLGLAEVPWPERLQWSEGEDGVDYGSRLGYQGFVPIFLAGLSEPKARFMEIVNPLLSRQVMAAVRALRPESRQSARAFTSIVDGLDRGVPYARSSSTPSFSGLLESPELADIVVRELVSERIERLLPGDGGLRLLAALAVPATGRTGAAARAKSLAKRATVALPVRWSTRLQPVYTGPDRASARKIAWRALLASRTAAMLEHDGGALSQRQDAPGRAAPGS